MRGEYWDLGIEGVKRGDGTWVIYDGRQRAECEEKKRAEDLERTTKSEPEVIAGDIHMPEVANNSVSEWWERRQCLDSTDTDDYADALPTLLADNCDGEDESREAKRRRMCNVVSAAQTRR